MCAYFNFLNASKSDEDDFGKVESLIDEFCCDHSLLAKTMKEVHFLCLQLEKMMKEDIMLSSGDATSFGESEFKPPTPAQEVVLQQAIVSGLIENFARQATIFDKQGNVVPQTNKGRIRYEA